MPLVINALGGRQTNGQTQTNTNVQTKAISRNQAHTTEFQETKTVVDAVYTY